jgi:glycosyltransferase involved in cell wall biosynthesis
MRLYYVANARMPNPKAHGIQIAKTCGSFIELGVEVVLVVPNRGGKGSLKEFYDLNENIEVIYLPVVNLYDKGRVGFFISSTSFIVCYLLFFIKRVFLKESFIIYSVDMDTFSSTPLSVIPRLFFSEMHGVRRSNIVTRLFFKHVDGIIAINKHIGNELVKTFGFSVEKMLVEPNGTNVLPIDKVINKSEARLNLKIGELKKIALYVGRFYGWKDLNILTEVAEISPQVSFCVIGGTKDEYISVTGIEEVPSNLIFYGPKPHKDIPTWTAAADVLLVLGTKKNESSYLYTSPMKAFEYMAAVRPIVTSDTPAMRDIFDDKEAYFYVPDDASNLAKVINSAIEGEKHLVTQMAYKKALLHTWNSRAKRIIDFIDSKTV